MAGCSAKYIGTDGWLTGKKMFSQRYAAVATSPTGHVRPPIPKLCVPQIPAKTMPGWSFSVNRKTSRSLRFLRCIKGVSIECRPKLTQPDPLTRGNPTLHYETDGVSHWLTALYQTLTAPHMKEAGRPQCCAATGFRKNVTFVRNCVLTVRGWGHRTALLRTARPQRLALTSGLDDTSGDHCLSELGVQPLVWSSDQAGVAGFFSA